MNRQKLLSLRPSGLIRRLLIAWLLAVLVEYMLLPGELRNLSGLTGLRQMSFPRLVTVTALVTVALTVLSKYFKTITAERWCVPALFLCMTVLAMVASPSIPLLWASLLVLAVLLVYGLRGCNRSRESIVRPQAAAPHYLWVTAASALVFFLFVSAWTVARVAVLGTSTYDFGIFAQMFHYMKETGLPMTTLERDGLLSHFDVHVSPIYYLMLPFYCLVPSPATLQVLQAAVMASAVIPLWKLGAQYGLTGNQRTLLCAVLLLYPAFSGGASYDLHENCFLTPLLLWLFYGIGQRSTPITAVSAVLTLMVKEDSAVYVAVIGLWLLVKTALRHKKLDRRNLLTGGLLLGTALLWFFLTTGYLAENGDGVMTGRYDNYIYDDSGSLLTVIKAVLLNPMKVIYECADPEKLEYIALTMLPLLGLPLLTCRYERYVLLIPYVLFNLMSDYPYQHSIYFQYSYGSIAFLMYLTAVNLADWKQNRHRVIALTISLCICAVCFLPTVFSSAMYYPNKAIQNFSTYQAVRDTLELIPEDASVTSTGYYTTHLANREILYDLRYTTTDHLLESEYVVIQPKDNAAVKKFVTAENSDGLENLLTLLEENGYEPFAEIEGTLLIYQKVQ